MTDKLKYPIKTGLKKRKEKIKEPRRICIKHKYRDAR